MHIDPNYISDRKQFKITEMMARELYQNAKQYEKSLQDMQASFQNSKDHVYYVVSTKFIQQWTELCLSTDQSRLSPKPMNYDLYVDNKLRRGLTEKVDFELVNQQIYSLFKPFTDQTNLNKREAVFIGQQKRVPIYLNTYKYIVTTLAILKEIDFNRYDFEKFVLQQLQLSELSTLQHLVDLVRQKERIPKRWDTRLWLPEKQLTPEKLYKLIKAQLKPCSVATYKIQGVGKRLENLDAKIEEVLGGQDCYFVIEAKTEDQRYVFVKDNEGRCEGCNHFGVLDFPCGCQKVKYCSEACIEKDKRYHTRTCAYAQQMQLNKRIDMTIDPDNRHGLVGLNNLGNTCFMNSCLQCLSHTMPLTGYFLNSYFEAEINKKNVIGSKGKLAKNYAKFIKGMWCDKENVYGPYSIKNAVSDINPMFSGYAQHDSQEFFSFLADGLHEDLNRIQVKPYVPSVQEQNKTEVQLARQSWIAHLKRNQSIITDLMTGQYRSIVTCPDCQHQSTTFDPFTTVSLTIPQTTETVTDFFLIYGNMQKKTKRGWFKYTSNDAAEWNKKACEAVGADVTKCNLYAVSAKQNIYKVGRQSMAEIAHKIESQGKNLFLIEMNQQELVIPKQNSFQLTFRISKSAYYRTEDLFFKLPMIFDKTKGITGLELYLRILKFLYPEAYNNSKSRKSFLNWGGKEYQDYEKQMLQKRPFKIILRMGKKIQRSYSRVEVQFQKQIQIEDQTSVVKILEAQGLRGNECEIDARFEKGKTDDFSFDKLKDFDTFGKQPRAERQSQEMELDRCLSSFSSPEILEAGNEWYCPKCKDHKLAQKQLSIYRAPKILILHLKRFKQKGTFKKEKNESLIHFPQTLDLSPYVIDKKPVEAYKEEIEEPIYIKPKADDLPLIVTSTNSAPTYELYAISNHFGGLGGGHYTAYAKNQGEWYEFDDSRVGSSRKKEIVSSSAYILFYERKQ